MSIHPPLAYPLALFVGIAFSIAITTHTRIDGNLECSSGCKLNSSRLDTGQSARASSIRTSQHSNIQGKNGFERRPHATEEHAKDPENRQSSDAALSILIGDRPELAALKLNSLAPGNMRRQFEYELAEKWARLDIDAAFAWVGTLPENNHTFGLYQTILQYYISVEPAEAANWLLQSNDPLLLQTRANQVAHNLALSNIDDAVNWIRKIPDTALHRSALTRVWNVWGEHAPESAYNAALEWKDPSQRNQLILNSSFAFAATNPEWALSQIHRIDRVPIQISVVKNLIAEWARTQPEHAKRWIEQQEHSPIRHAAIQSLVDTINMSQPELSFGNLH